MHQHGPVALVAWGQHSLPQELRTIGGEHRVTVVARVRGREVRVRLGGQVVAIDIRIGGGGVDTPLALLAGVEDGITLRAPGHLLGRESGRHGAIPRLILKEILPRLGLTIHKISQEEVAVTAIHPVVPVAVHQAIDDAHVGLAKVRVTIGCGLLHLHELGVKETSGIGGEPE